MSDLRAVEAKSIHDFIEQAGIDGYLSGRVLDYGCGKQPYRSLVESFGAEYAPFDRADFPANVSGEDIGGRESKTGERYVAWAVERYDTILCTQVLQYVPYYPYYSGVQELLGEFFSSLEDYEKPPNEGGHLVLTYPTNWPEVEQEDLHRFTKAGMERLLTETGFTIVRHDFRHGIQHEGVSFAMGYGVIARA